MTNRLKKKSKAGAKVKYNESFPLLAEGFARQGMTDKAISQALGISQETFYQYLKKYSEFSECISRGRHPHNIEVENAMLLSAKGYYRENTKIEKFKDGSGKVHVKETIEKKWYPPNFNAGAHWLKINHSDVWGDNKDNDNADLPTLVVEEIGQDERPDGSTIDEDLQ